MVVSIKKKRTEKYNGVRAVVDLEGSNLKISGPLGVLEKNLGGSGIVVLESNKVFVNSKMNFYGLKAQLGRWLAGVSDGFLIELTFTGLGYRFIQQGRFLLLKLGYAHYIEIPCPESIHAFGYKKRLILFGIDYQELKNFVEQLRSLQNKDNYKGKGIQVAGIMPVLKVGKQKS